MRQRPEPDIAFMRRVHTTLRDLPNWREYPGLYWDQGVFREVYVDRLVRTDTGEPMCETAMCFAGWAVELSPDITWAHDTMALRSMVRNTSDSEPVVLLRADLTTAHDSITGEQLRAAEYARRRLGLTHIQADELFGSDNSLHDLAEIIDRIEKGAL
ncbi:hypothetical protein [Nocardia transvalensis]|uniref:hypothetical protein n=1 Tax=Nocardia transvalensis TaxID=37333 RepID=UPI001894A4F3|nr:hypothetical protein [Nocardia transvalensis]MBF6333365.1 hypothetical protein [Nocardia transvalensis]